MKITNLAEETRIALANLAERTTGLAAPSLRLGVTGLSRAGKTVFIAAMIHNLVQGGRLPLFKAYASGRVSGAVLRPQPDDDVPRFDYETHISNLVDDRVWPESTRRISELRLTISFESANLFGRTLGRGRLNIDIVDYPGEWLLDLPLLSKSYANWSADTISRAKEEHRAQESAAWLSHLGEIDPARPADEMVARQLASSFTDFLRLSRDSKKTLSTLPPGRFLMPGDLEGSPALTFSPLPGVGTNDRGSLFHMMDRRYEAYKSAVVKPFFRDHFARLDRQIVLVDALHAINAGPTAVRDLETALAEILVCFRPGRSNWLSRLVSRRIDRVLFAATKADHLHHTDHDRLESILNRLLTRAKDRASIKGAGIATLAMAAVRATREGTIVQKSERLPSIIGTPIAGETLDGRTFDGETEIALFPGDLPAESESLFRTVDADAAHSAATGDDNLRFLRFRPPPIERTGEGLPLSLPHIRLDRALEFLVGDKLA